MAAYGLKQRLYAMHCKFSCMLKLFQPLVSVLIRLYVASIFIQSGLTKVDDWQATLFLFRNEYKIPFMPYQMAAMVATLLELVVAPMLALGLATRYGAILLCAMTFVMNYAYQEAAENYYWMSLFAVLIVYGGSKLSLDYLIKRKCCEGQACPCCNSSPCCCCGPSCMLNTAKQDSKSFSVSSHGGAMGMKGKRSGRGYYAKSRF